MGNSAENQPKLILRRTLLRQTFTAGAGIVLSAGFFGRIAEASMHGDPLNPDPTPENHTYSELEKILSDPNGIDTLSKNLSIILENDTDLHKDVQTSIVDSGQKLTRYMLVDKSKGQFIYVYVPDGMKDLPTSLAKNTAILIDKFTPPDGTSLGLSAFPLLYKGVTKASPPAAPKPTAPACTPLIDDPCSPDQANLASIRTN